MKALAAGQNMRIAEEYARTVGIEPGTTQYPPTPPYAPPGEHPIAPMLSPDEGSIPDTERSSMLGKEQVLGEKSDSREKSPIESASPLSLAPQEMQKEQETRASDPLTSNPRTIDTA